MLTRKVTSGQDEPKAIEVVQANGEVDFYNEKNTVRHHKEDRL